MEEYSVKQEKELFEKFKEYMMDESPMRFAKGGRMYKTGGRMYEDDYDYPKKRYMHEGGKFGYDEHFDKEEAKAIVAEMYHIEGDKKYVGEKYSQTFAKDVMEKHKNHLPEDVTCADVYVAINAQYHDYAKLFHKWFGNSIDTHIIDSAIMVWFKDDDYHKGNKIFNYFED